MRRLKKILSKYLDDRDIGLHQVNNGVCRKFISYLYSLGYSMTAVNHLINNNLSSFPVNTQELASYSYTLNKRANQHQEKPFTLDMIKEIESKLDINNIHDLIKMIILNLSYDCHLTVSQLAKVNVQDIKVAGSSGLLRVKIPLNAYDRNRYISVYTMSLVLRYLKVSGFTYGSLLMNLQRKRPVSIVKIKKEIEDCLNMIDLTNKVYYYSLPLGKIKDALSAGVNPLEVSIGCGWKEVDKAMLMLDMTNEMDSVKYMIAEKTRL